MEATTTEEAEEGGEVTIHFLPIQRTVPTAAIATMATEMAIRLL